VKLLVQVGAIVVATGVLGLFLLSVLVVAVVADQIQASQTPPEWDIPPEVIPALQAAGAQAGVSWFLLAGVASVATDFGRNAPDGVARGTTAGTAIFRDVTPPIKTKEGGFGMFLVEADSATPVLSDPQDVSDAADWLAGQLAERSLESPLAQGSLTDPDVSQFWKSVLATAPLAITSAAPTGDDAAPVPSGANPIQQFGTAVLTNIGAPTSSSNLGAFAAWAAGEGTCAGFNPLATTQPEPGATPFNTLSDGGHVWNYPSFDVGVRATTTALTNGRYGQVIAAFQADAGVDSVAAAVEASPWGTHHFGSPTYAGRQCGGAAPSQPPTVSGPDTVAATIVARALTYQAIWSEMTGTTTPATTPGP
jgi:hypothetical protein